jgi:preprotein translocase subunit SecG
MKMTRIVMLSLAVAVYATAALAQHAHGGGMGSTMSGNAGSGMSHNSGSGRTKTNSSGSTHQPTVNDILTKNSAISGKIQTLTGMSATQACAGFKNLGQCVAAAHVSKNLHISFDCLRSDMTGIAPQGTSCPAGTGTKSMSLGKAIRTLDPTADQKAESKKGQTEAQRDIKSSGV